MEELFLQRLRDIPILDLASRLGISVKNKKSYCFAEHDVASPSLNFHLERNRWYCFGCHRHGDTIALVEQKLEIDFLAACNWLSEIWGYEKPKNSSKRIRHLRKFPATQKNPTMPQQMAGDSELYSWLISRCGKVVGSAGAAYFDAHGIPIEIANKFKIVEMKNPWTARSAMIRFFGIERVILSGLVSADGETPLWSGYSLIFPFFYGATIEYLQVRRLPGTSGPKFVTPRNISQKIFNANAISLLTPGATLHICEGVPDTLALESVGIPAIGILGSSAFKKEWIDQLLPFDLVVVPDADRAGQAFGKSIRAAFSTRSKSIRVATPQAGKDASEVIYRSRNAGLFRKNN